ncbi:RtcB [Sorangium cellulosum]|uniref:3'-phosphate/5'-hydroxy nucleic acid ligase n=1 Tax=Sorangium cellulosum TaxID=56 RepID=A0A4P2Q118_SORCE|nr:RtcB family protein [Sorangium cellulosum]AUX22915.1 RtcB [Sorangium cellulosum]
MSARVATWLPDGAGAELSASLARLARTEDVAHVAVMPDAHVADDVCVGTVTATTRRLLPAAVGGDIGCGMVALRLRAGADLLADRDRAARLLSGLYRRVPHLVHPAEGAPSLPEDLLAPRLGAPSLEAMKRREGRTQLGTLGRGNHFLEIQRDEEGALWLLLHSGSRAMGPAIRRHHEALAARDPSGVRFLDADSEAGRAYLDDVAWAARYARASRARMVAEAAALFAELFGVDVDAPSRIEVDHNHVRREEHGGRALWVHRKGAMGLRAGDLGVVPGSMGSPSFHVEGRGHPEALGSSAHGAGRALPRGEARRRIGARQLLREAGGAWFDHRIADRLRDEAPSAYKDVGAVMRAQRELVRVVRRLAPVLVYKAA